MKIARYFEQKENSTVKCCLCPNLCVIQQNKRGKCRVRKNIEGNLFSEIYGRVSALNLDSTEKKPLYHFFPGSKILSIGGIGCNLHCNFCQNWHISQASVDNFTSLQNYSIDKILKIALKQGNNIGIAYTYNEPVVWFEFMIDIAKQAQNKALKNVMVTNGYINQKPLVELITYIDAFNVDLKAFSEDFYIKQTNARLEPVKQTIKTIKKKNKHLEITNLVIPGLNDDEKLFEEMVLWIAGETGKNTVLHLSRYFPVYESTIPDTPVSKLLKLYDIATKHLNYVYLGNVITDYGQNTYCNNCGKLLIKRQGYHITKTGIDKDNKCKYCGSATGII